MRVLITGGAGFIGSHTTDLFLRRGYKVRILDNLSLPVHPDGALPAHIPRDHIEFVNGDVRDKHAWEKSLKNVNIVVHLAAYQDYLIDFSKFFHVNAVGTALLYEVMVERKLKVQKVIVASSQAVYGEGLNFCLNNDCTLYNNPQYPPARLEKQLNSGNWPILCPNCHHYLVPQPTSEEFVNPNNQYAMSKLAQEMIALNLGRQYGIPSVVLRYSITQGPYQSFYNAYSGVLRIFAQQILNNSSPIVYEDGNQLRDYISVHDVAEANLLIMESDCFNYQTVNVGGEKAIAVKEYAKIIAREAGLNSSPLTPGFYRLGDVRHIFSDTKKLHTLGWKPKVSVVEVIQSYLEWVVQQEDFADYSAIAINNMKRIGTLRSIQ